LTKRRRATYGALMHEVDIAASILEIVQAEASSRAAPRVTAIVVRIGELTALVPDALRFAFEALAKGTCASEATLEIDARPWVVTCGTCAIDFRVVDGLPRCPTCGGARGELVSGRELQVVQITLDEDSPDD
jgi:hydrogenase nickel incorporation protein HypA/HybF